MKVKIETEEAARRFNCEVGDHRDLQHPDALALIETKDASAVEVAAPPAKKKATGRKTTRSRRS